MRIYCSADFLHNHEIAWWNRIAVRDVKSLFAGCCLVGMLAGIAAAQDGTRAGDFVVEHPTLLNLGFEWAIEGDANRNASVAVRFRAAGQSDWRPALPLVRIGGERVYRVRE